MTIFFCFQAREAGLIDILVDFIATERCGRKWIFLFFAAIFCDFIKNELSIARFVQMLAVCPHRNVPNESAQHGRRAGDREN